MKSKQKKFISVFLILFSLVLISVFTQNSNLNIIENQNETVIEKLTNEEVINSDKLKSSQTQKWYIKDNSGKDLYNFQVMLELDTETLISEGKLNLDGSDLRAYNSTYDEIPYWIESGINTNETKIWVNVPYIPANGHECVCLEYGTPTLESKSNGSLVFPILFDDGEQASNGEALTTGGWVVHDGSSSYQTYSNDYSANGELCLKLDSDTPNHEQMARYDLTPQNNITIEWSFYDEGLSDVFQILRIVNSTNSERDIGIAAGSWAESYFGAGCSAHYYMPGAKSILRSNGWKQARADLNGTHISVYINDTLGSITPFISPFASIMLRDGRLESSTYNESYFDMIRVRKYIANEPSVKRYQDVWNVDPILIDNNWTDVEEKYDWCSGSGIQEDPFVIENLMIETDGSSSCLQIKNSDDFFTIKSCNFSSSAITFLINGLEIYNCSNGHIENNTCSHNFVGIAVTNCSYFLISGNLANFNDNSGITLNTCNHTEVIFNNFNNTVTYDGMYITDCYNITILENVACHNARDGIALIRTNYSYVEDNELYYNKYGLFGSYSEHNFIKSNDANHNSWYGFLIETDCENNTFYRNYICNNSIYGIFLKGDVSECNFNNLTDNNVFNNTDRGIYFLNSHNNTISGNFVQYNGESSSGAGIYLMGCENCTLFNNTALYNKEVGIHLYNSSFCFLWKNNASLNTDHGLYIHYHSRNNTVFQNYFIYQQLNDGIAIDDHCEFNNISSNLCSKNVRNGIFLQSYGSQNIFNGNNLSENSQYGIYIWDSSDQYNQIFNNIFSENVVGNAYDVGTSNSWDNGVIGNKWDDYKGIDIDGDGIGETPYSIDGVAGSQDNFPLCEEIATIIYVDVDNTGEETGSISYPFNTIQEAIDAAISGKTIYIFNGTYHEHITINKALNIIGESRLGTIIDGDGTGTIVTLTVFNINITQFTITDGVRGIYGDNVDFSTIDECNIEHHNDYGIRIINSEGIQITNCNVSDIYGAGTYETHIGIAIGMEGNPNSLIENVTMFENKNDCRIFIPYSSGGTYIRNVELFNNTGGIYSGFATYYFENIYIHNNTWGLTFNGASNGYVHDSVFEDINWNGGYSNGVYMCFGASNNVITNCIFIDNFRGINLESDAGSNNQFYNNYFINNSIQASVGTTNSQLWDNGTIGNYWSDYSGDDSDDDGIGDSPYNITTSPLRQDVLTIWNDGFNGSRIIIDDSSSNDWSWAVTRIWCSGSGTKEDPYIIKDLVIDGQNAGSCITILGGEVYFKIINCTLYNAGTSWSHYGIDLYGTKYGEIINNTCYSNFNGICVFYCSNITISGNELYSQENTALFLHTSENIIVRENEIHDNVNGGIYIGHSNSNEIELNTILNGLQGIVIHNSTDCLFTGNYINTTFVGIYLVNSTLHTFANNLLYNRGFILWSALEFMNCHSIDTSNLMNDRPIYYRVNETYLRSEDFSNPGQILLVNCNHSLLSGFTFNYTTVGIGLYYSDNNTLENIISSYNVNGIYMLNCNNNTILNSNLFNNTWNGIKIVNCSFSKITDNELTSNDLFGIELQNSDENIIVNNNILNSEQGIYLNQDCSFNSLQGNTVNNNDYGIYLFQSYNNSLTENTANSNEIAGIYLLDSVNNTIEKNLNSFSYNGNYGIYLENSNRTNIFNNFIGYNQYGIYFNSSNLNNVENNFIIGNTIKAIESEGVCNNNIGVNTYQLDEEEEDDDDTGKEDDKGREPPIIIIIIIIIIIGSAIAVPVFYVKTVKSKTTSKKQFKEHKPTIKEEEHSREQETERKKERLLKHDEKLTIQAKEVVKPKVAPTVPKKAKKDSGFEFVPMELTAEEKAELTKTESEVEVDKNKITCIVHRGLIHGTGIYLCKHCDTFYCERCAKVLKIKGEKCWTCDNEIDIPVTAYDRAVLLERKAIEILEDLINEKPFLRDFIQSTKEIIDIPKVKDYVFSILETEELDQIDLLRLNTVEKKQFIKEILHLNVEERRELIEDMLKKL